MVGRMPAPGKLSFKLFGKHSAADGRQKGRDVLRNFCLLSQHLDLIELSTKNELFSQANVGTSSKIDQVMRKQNNIEY